MLHFTLPLLLAVSALAGPELSDRLQITEVTGPPDVKVTRAAGNRVEQLHRGENVFVGDRIEVAPRQIVGISSYDGGSWRLAPGTRFKAEARKPDAKTLAYWSFELASGAMYGKVPKRNEPKDGYRLKVHTRTAALGIRGTEYVMSGDDAAPAVDVLEGVVWWGTDPGFAAGTYKEVAAGHHADLSGGHIRIVESRGDREKLLHDYGLYVDEEAKKVHGTAQQCAAQGMGWRSGDGSSGGECFRHSEGDE